MALPTEPAELRILVDELYHENTTLRVALELLEKKVRFTPRFWINVHRVRGIVDSALRYNDRAVDRSHQ
ncbi:hypothetical protein [Cupriavidus campinensis]|uniref:hypothetical protein n=1 Tax=Cupriavidus campinensis TaxID=151783 RepID=UPI0011EF5E7E|nr:hypothetical protein [Cupriavidus campinensis]